MSVFISRPNLIFLLFIFFSILTLNFLTPVHSDDFQFGSFGPSIQPVIDLYFDWIGRVIGVSLSHGLMLLPYPLRVFLNALVVVLVLLVAVKAVFGKERVDYKLLLFFFLVYWAGNPSLGQTFFWTVGSASYLWTALIYLIFIALTLRQFRGQEGLNTGLYALVAFLSGMTNENMALALIAFLMVLTYLHWKEEGKLKPEFIWGLVALGGGAAVLLLAPGNFKRAAHPLFQEWMALSPWQMIKHHLLVRMPRAQAAYLPTYVTFIFLLLFARFKKIKMDPCHKRLSLIFFFLSVFSTLVLLPSPAIPHRAYFGGFVFLLLSLISAIKGMGVSNILKDRSSWFFRSLTALLGLYFIVTYGLMFEAYSKTKKQEKIREHIVASALESGEPSVSLPDFYFTYLISRRHRFDTYYNEKDMAQYYGVSDVDVLKVNFDYSDFDPNNLNPKKYCVDCSELSEKELIGPFSVSGLKVFFKNIPEG